MYLQIGTKTKPVLTSSLFYRHRACLGAWEAGRRKRRRWSCGHTEWRGSDYMKPNTAASKTMVSDRRARGGCVIDTLAESNGAVLALQWGEAAKEHGGGVW